MGLLDGLFGDINKQLDDLMPKRAKYKIVGGRKNAKGTKYQTLTKAWSLEEAKRLVKVWSLHYGEEWHVTYYNIED